MTSTRRLPCTRGQEAPGRTRRDQGVALVEFALILPFLAILVFGTLDLARAWQLQNRLSNAAREGAASAQFSPSNVNAGCDDGNNVRDRAGNEEASLSTEPGYSITVAKITGGVATAYTGCGTTTPSMALAGGDTIRVTARADLELLTPLVGALVGNPLKVDRSTEVVVQG